MFDDKKRILCPYLYLENKDISSLCITRFRTMLFAVYRYPVSFTVPCILKYLSDSTVKDRDRYQASYRRWPGYRHGLSIADDPAPQTNRVYPTLVLLQTPRSI